MRVRAFKLEDLKSNINQYVTRSGLKVSNVDASRPAFFPVHGTVNGENEAWTNDGKYTLGSTFAHNMDLMTVVEDLVTVVDDAVIKDLSKGENVLSHKEALNNLDIHSGDAVAYHTYGTPVFGLSDKHKDELNKNLVEEVKKIFYTDNDPVNKPAHYTDGKIEVIDFIDDKKFDFCIGNAIKYLSRAGKKENEIEDLEKAVWYIQHKVNKLKNG